MHKSIDRRRFLLGLGAAAATQTLPSAVRAAMSSIRANACAACATSAFAMA